MLFRANHPGFGTATLVLPFIPATAASLVFLKRKDQQEEGDTCLGKFLRHLPGVQIWTHQKMLREVAELQNDISDRQEYINQFKKEVQTEETKAGIEFCEKRILENENKINKIKTDLQSFKIYAAIFESLPQFILQCSILVKRIYANKGRH